LENFNFQEFTMKTTTLASAMLAASMFIGSFAMAEGNSHLKNRVRQDQGQRANPHDRDDDQGSSHRKNKRNHGHGHDQQKHYDRGERGAGPEHSYYRGERMPLQYRTRQYVVEDWRGHRLSAPPRGYHWVQSGNDYVLVAIATGIILQLMLNY
jgi:Ni/Co efflux regulator RcnB